MLIPFETLQEKYNAHPKSVLHIGASHGEERDTYNNNGVEAVMWVEAIPHIFERLKENLAADDGQRYLGHTAVNACVHEVSGLELDFNVSSNEGQSSSIFDLGTHADVHPDVTYTHAIKVKTKRADEICIFVPDMVNLDIQGAELLALKSMSWLSGVKYVYTEVNSKELYVGCALIGEIDEYLAGFGFERVETVWTDCFWGDAFYVNSRVVVENDTALNIELDVFDNNNVLTTFEDFIDKWGMLANDLTDDIKQQLTNDIQVQKEQVWNLACKTLLEAMSKKYGSAEYLDTIHRFSHQECMKQLSKNIVNFPIPKM